MIALLREQLATSGVNIPRVLAFRPDLQLLLLEAIPGKPQVARLLKARLSGKSRAGGLTLENAISACGRIAAAMHDTSIEPDRRRTLEHELDWQQKNIQALARISPELGARLQSWLEQAITYAGRSTPLPLCFSHGDFTYTQLIFDDQQSGLVDFDTVCQAEPALDLGQFLAYQQLAILKDQPRDAPMPAAAIQQLCDIFLDTYIAQRGASIGNEQQLRDRTALYQVLMLLRLAIHSWQKLKISRLEHALTLLEERVLCLR
jgi:aminoglycoside phosphotransferase (APT) family kinase protein